MLAFFGWTLGLGLATTFGLGLTAVLTGPWGSEYSSSDEDSCFFCFRPLVAFAFLSTEAFLWDALTGADFYSSTDTFDPFLGALLGLVLAWTGV